MAHKNTLAILGATTTVGTIIAKSIAAHYRLLLMDASQRQLALLLADVEKNDGAEVCIINCCKDASWEADVIIVAVENTALIGVAEKIKEVTTCKSVIYFTDNNDIEKLQKLLPNAAVVTVVIPNSFTNVKPLEVYGDDVQTIDIANQIVRAISRYQSVAFKTIISTGNH